MPCNTFDLMATLHYNIIIIQCTIVLTTLWSLEWRYVTLLSDTSLSHAVNNLH